MQHLIECLKDQKENEEVDPEDNLDMEDNLTFEEFGIQYYFLFI